jgi:hypothetical protein
MNGYSYANNNPVNLTDHSGLCPFCVLAVGALIMGGVTAASYDVFVNQGFGGENLFRRNLSEANWGRAAGVGGIGAGIGVVTAASAVFIGSQMSGLAAVAGQQGIGSLAFTQAARAAMWNIGGTLVLDSLAYRGLSHYVNTGRADVGQLLREESHNPILASMFLADFGLGALAQFQALGGWRALRAQWQAYEQPVPVNEAEVFISGNRVIVRGQPGAQGVRVPRRLTVEEMNQYTLDTGVEYLLAYKPGPGRNGGGGQYWLYSGTENQVNYPVDAYAIYHTHPSGSITPSGYINPATGRLAGDIGALDFRSSQGNPQQSSQFIPRNGAPVRYWINGDYTSGGGFRNVFYGNYFTRR